MYDLPTFMVGLALGVMLGLVIERYLLEPWAALRTTARSRRRGR